MHQERFCKTQHVTWSFSFVSPFSSSSSSILGVFNKNADLIKKIMFTSTSIRIGATNVPNVLSRLLLHMYLHPLSGTDAVGVMAATHCHSWWRRGSDTLWVTLPRFWLHSFLLCMFGFGLTLTHYMMNVIFLNLLSLVTLVYDVYSH